MTTRIVPEPHPLNQGFEWPDRPTAPLAQLTPDHITQWNRDGYLALAQLWPAEQIAALTAAIDPIEATVDDTVLTMTDQPDLIYARDEMSFAKSLAAHLPLVRDFALAPLFKRLMHDLIGPDVRLYWDQAVYKKPQKARDFPWHQDNGYGFVAPQTYVTCWIPLTAATVDNGCPWVLPGWHRKGTLRHDHNSRGLEIMGIGSADEAVAVPAIPGDMVVFSSLTPHRTGPNLTDVTRKALILQYIPDGAVLVDHRGDHPITDPVNNPLL